MKLEGKVLKVGDHVDTDVIIPARHLHSTDHQFLAEHCFEDLDITIEEGDILLAGNNFGCGSSREHAPIALKATGISCIIAKSFARIFYRNAINIGLPIIVSKETVEGSQEGDRLQVETDSGVITNISADKRYTTQPLPPFIHEIMDAGGLLEYITRRM